MALSSATQWVSYGWRHLMGRASERGLIALLVLVSGTYAVAEQLSLVSAYPPTLGTYEVVRVSRNLGAGTSSATPIPNVVIGANAATTSPADGAADLSLTVNGGSTNPNEQSVINLLTREAVPNGTVGIDGENDRAWHLVARGDNYPAAPTQANDLMFWRWNDPTTGSGAWGLTMDLDGNTGRVGIGGIDEPGYLLDVTDRIRVRQGASGTAGIWFYQTNAPAGDRAFMGMADDDEVGFYGSTGGWGVKMNITDGKLTLSSPGLYNASGYQLIEANATDWIRIGNSPFTNGAAIYNNIATNGGLSVGDWRRPANGDFYATGNMDVNNIWLRSVSRWISIGQPDLFWGGTKRISDSEFGTVTEFPTSIGEVYISEDSGDIRSCGARSLAIPRCKAGDVPLSGIAYCFWVNWVGGARGKLDETFFQDCYMNCQHPTCGDGNPHRCFAVAGTVCLDK
jgi:hypothetical protein